jgi:hypothetical protein
MENSFRFSTLSVSCEQTPTLIITLQQKLSVAKPRPKVDIRIHSRVKEPTATVFQSFHSVPPQRMFRIGPLRKNENHAGKV